jgi:hypothetical protein
MGTNAPNTMQILRKFKKNKLKFKKRKARQQQRQQTTEFREENLYKKR